MELRIKDKSEQWGKYGLSMKEKPQIIGRKFSPNQINAPDILLQHCVNVDALLSLVYQQMKRCAVLSL